MRRRFENNFNSGVEEGDIVQFEESTTYTFPFNCVVDLFLVGGGGGGGPAYDGGNNGHGGCGGFTLTQKNITFVKNQSISIIIGDGGKGGYYSRLGTNGGDTKVILDSGTSYIAQGGSRGYYSWGNPPDGSETNSKKLGGSGGGVGRVGPTDGASNGGSRSGVSYEGHTINMKGQGTTTAAFGEDNGEGPYYGAGGAACGYSSLGVHNGEGGDTGGGTWGISGGNGLFFGAGGSGADFFTTPYLNPSNSAQKQAGDGYQGVVLMRFKQINT